MRHTDDQPQPMRHLVKWNDGQDNWVLDITPGNIQIKTTAPIGDSNRAALEASWGAAYDFINRSFQLPKDEAR